MLGNYRIERTLGTGGMGRVYLAEHVLIQRKVALKVLLPRLAREIEYARRFVAEARMTASVAHPGVVKVFDFGYHADGRSFLAMEYLAGETLQKRLDRCGILSIGDALDITQQLACALHAIHTSGLVHRDLKPANIILVPDPTTASGQRVKIIDFGVAATIGSPSVPAEMDDAGMLIGTPPYMAPEQCQGAAPANPSIDIYALGCILFQLLCGRTPFVASAVADLVRCHLYEPAPSPCRFVPAIPPDLNSFVLRALHKNPQQRLGSAQAFLDGLAKLPNTTTDTGTRSPRPVADHDQPDSVLAPVAPLAVSTAEFMETLAYNADQCPTVSLLELTHTAMTSSLCWATPAAPGQLAAQPNKRPP